MIKEKLNWSRLLHWLKQCIEENINPRNLPILSEEELDSYEAGLIQPYDITY